MTVPLPELLPDISETTKPFTVPSATPLPVAIGGGNGSGGTDGGGSFDSGQELPGWSGWWVFLAIFLAVLLIFVFIMCFVSHYHRPRIQQYFKNLKWIPEGSREVLHQSIIMEQRPLLARSRSIIAATQDLDTTSSLRLWNAVALGENEEVEQVLATLNPNPETALEGFDTSPYEEAHHRGYYHVLKALDAFMKRQPQVPDSDIIIRVMQSALG
ncbi:hypothetical protein SK128_016928 [Halocaridina rubra]|uniref:Uncharacterized protein n=1 Tax=Halocaridina rubra TaxID=373956 RepID=A0AAN8WB70_HALRR